jgi:hypothetical protein
LESAVRDHAGHFFCERIHAPNETKVVDFRHVADPPVPVEQIPNVGRLVDFYDTFGSVVFYFDERSGDAAVHIASPSAWGELADQFGEWLTSLSEEERAEVLPDWIDECLVIGEEPQTGNYILMPTTGDSMGRVFLFDHDGFEFVDEGADLVAFVERLISPDDSQLNEMASHLRFIEDDPAIQWWIRELRDNRGNVARTSA